MGNHKGAKGTKGNRKGAKDAKKNEDTKGGYSSTSSFPICPSQLLSMNFGRWPLAVSH